MAVLALGIGANTAVFSLVHTLLFQSPGYPNPGELVQVYSQDKKNPKTFPSFSYPTYLDIKEQNTVFSETRLTISHGRLGERRDAPNLAASSRQLSPVSGGLPSGTHLPA